MSGTAKKCGWFTWRRLLLSFGSLAVLVVVVLGSVWLIQARMLETSLAALRAEGMPSNVVELIKFHQLPEGVINNAEIWTAAFEEIFASDPGARGKALPVVGNGPKPTLPPDGEWPEFKASQAYVESLNQGLEAIWNATDAGGEVRISMVGVGEAATEYDRSQNCRVVIRILTLDAYVSAYSGDSSRALKDVLSIFSVADILHNAPLFLPQLARIGLYRWNYRLIEELIPICNWDDAQLSQLQTRIAEANFKLDLKKGLCSERGCNLSAIEMLQPKPFQVLRKRELLRQYARSIETFSHPWPELLTEQEILDSNLSEFIRNPMNHILYFDVINCLPPGVAAVGGAGGEAMKNCILAVIAVQRYRLQHKKLPTSLQDIDAYLLEALGSSSPVLTDPFDGQPLRTKFTEEEFVIYSVGENRVDDGGQEKSPDQPLPYPLDMVFRLRLNSLLSQPLRGGFQVNTPFLALIQFLYGAT